jgi:hypothetical protein
VSSIHRSRAFRRGPIAHVPFLAAHHRFSTAALHAKPPRPQRYPAIGLALAATAVVLVPLTASAATTTTTSAHTSVRHVAAKQDSAAATKKSTATKKAADTKSSATAKSVTHTAAAQTATASAVSTKPYAGVTYAQLEPTGTEGSQQTFTPSAEQWANATAIVQAAKDLNLSAYAATIAVATAMQESSLHNLTTATNADSLGLFQQRPSMGWGTAAELTDPTYAAKAFLKELPSDYESMDLSDAAQSVQRSFDGSLYAQWEEQAAHMVYQIANS